MKTTKTTTIKNAIALFSCVLVQLSAGIALTTIFKTNAQTPNPTAPKFTSFKDAKNFKIKGNGNPFQPSNLQQEKKPDKPDDKEFKNRTVIGWDDRTPMLSRQYPWSAIGRVQGISTENKEYHCTGTLITEDVVLTNAHCVINPETRKLSQKIAFLPNVINGKVANRADVAEVVNVLYGTDFGGSALENQTNDWALFKLNKPIGLKYGYLGWKSLSNATLTRNKQAYIFVGYSGDFPDTSKENYRFFTAGSGFTASAQADCSITQAESNVLFHDCDTTGGSSGGAIIGVIGNKPYIVGLNNAERTDGSTNLGLRIDFLDRFAN
ncbi:trypsin-like serine peptidase [Brunnivagina elsteri]|uniref:Serine protease n=1 Tax=Brunnivagina elsteri CCALA 953 TaxID=987040 RepID=A0A2A2TC75_9CYAN|nr:trypsin-like serine protease [Calothrix elsteri]PAX51313.1 peptidase S1 [Calothrix elsteri CCALA 953]